MRYPYIQIMEAVSISSLNSCRLFFYVLILATGILLFLLLISEVSGEQNHTQESENISEFIWSEPNILIEAPGLSVFPPILTSSANIIFDSVNNTYISFNTYVEDFYQYQLETTPYFTKFDLEGKNIIYENSIENHTFSTGFVYGARDLIFVNSTDSFVWIEDSFSKNMTFYIYDLNGTSKNKIDLKFKGDVLDYCRDSEDNIHLVYERSKIYYTKIDPNGDILIDEWEVMRDHEAYTGYILVDSDDNPVIFAYGNDKYEYPILIDVVKLIEENNTIIKNNTFSIYKEYGFGTKVIDSYNHIHVFHQFSDDPTPGENIHWIEYYRMTDNGTILEVRTILDNNTSSYGLFVKIDVNQRIHLIYTTNDGTHHMILNTNGTILSDEVIGQPYYLKNGDFAIDSSGNLHLVGNVDNFVLYMRTNAPADLSIEELPVDRPENLTYNLTLTIPVRITNPGTVDAREIPVRFEVNGTEIENRTISLGPGENTTLNFNLTLGYNWTNCTIRIDTMGKLIESRVSNNEVKEDFYVPMPPPVEDDFPPDDDDEDGFIPAFTTPLLLLGAALSALVPGKKSRGRLS